MPAFCAGLSRTYDPKPCRGLDCSRQGARKPAIQSPSLRVVRLTEPSFSEGVEKHTVEGVSVHVYSAAKTVADCFKFRNKIGVDIAIEALKD